MPDYNPAIAAQIQPVQGPNVGQTLSTVADFQRAQAATALSQLQALQTQRKYNGLLAASQALAHGGDPLQAGAAAGADPADINQLLAAGSSQKFMAGHNGLAPAGAEANANIARAGAETRNLQDQNAGIQAEAQTKRNAYFGQVGSTLANAPTDENYKAALTAAQNGHISPERLAQLKAADTPDKRIRWGKDLQLAAMSPEDASKLESNDSTSQLTTLGGRLGTGTPAPPAPPAPQAGQPQAGTATSAQAQAAPSMPGVLRPAMSPGQQEQQKLTYQRSEQMYGGLRSQSSQYENDRPLITLAKSVLSNPDMYTGVGANAVLNFNKVKAAFGDTKAAMLQEALEKVTATNVLGQLNQQREELQGGGINGGRIFAPMVDLVSKASAQAGTTLAGNRLLMEIMDRKGQLNTKLRDMAADYRNAPANHGLLDAGFDTKVSQYLKNNPVFTDQELAHPELIGAPNAPAGLSDTQSRKAWIQGMGLHPGDPVRVNGQYKYLGQQ